MDSSQALLMVDDYAIWPYAPRRYPPDTLGVLWRTMYDEHALRRVFYESDTPLAVETTVSYFTQKNLLLYLITRADKDLVGAIWLSEVRPYRANWGFWYARAVQGARARAVSLAVCRWLFAAWDLRYMWGVTPWRMACRHGVLCGWTLVATLPDSIQVGGRMLPLYVLRCRRGEV